MTKACRIGCVGLLVVLTACEPLAEGRSANDCRDGADNDGDGAFDCGDSGCMGSPDCDSPPREDAGVDAGVRDGGVDAGTPDAGTDGGSCSADHTACDFDSDCCSNFCDIDGLCGTGGACAADDLVCVLDADCCSAVCNSVSSTCGCGDFDDLCSDDDDCCAPHLCLGGTCE